MRACAAISHSAVLPPPSPTLGNARHVRHNPEHAVAPLPPPLHVVAGCKPDAKQRVHQTHPPLFPAHTLPGRARGCSQLAGQEHRGRGRSAGGPAGQQSAGKTAPPCPSPAATNCALALNGHSAVLPPPCPTLGSVGHIRHSSEHAVAPLPPCLTPVGGRCWRPGQTASDGPTAASRACSPLTSRDPPEICWQGSWGSLGGIRAGRGACLRPPASHPARPL